MKSLRKEDWEGLAFLAIVWLAIRYKAKKRSAAYEKWLDKYFPGRKKKTK